MTGIAMALLSLVLAPFEIYLVRLGWTRVRPVHRLAGLVIALPSAVALMVLAAVLVVLAGVVGVLVLADPKGTATGEVVGTVALAVFSVGSFLLPMAQVAALAGAGVGLGLLAGRIRGTELDEREAELAGEMFD